MNYASIEDALLYGTGIERTFVCSAHNDHNASASVNVITGLFCCYACGHAGKVDTSKLTFNADGVARFTKKVFDVLAAENRYTESWLNIFDGTGPGDYWLSRFPEQTCRYFRLGTAPHVATYPMRDEAGGVLGIVTRDTTGKRKQKYLYPYGVSVSQHLIEAWRCTSETVILVEGMTDVAAIHAAGWANALGSYKAGLSHHQTRLLWRYAPRRLICAYDMDEAGESGWWRVQRQLKGLCPLQRLWWDGFKDIAAIPLSDRIAMLSEVLGRHTVDSVDRLG